MRLHFVLDTNCFRGLTREDLDRLASLGLPIRLSDLAYTETWAHSVAKYKAGKKSRCDARGLFFSRVKRVLPYLDNNEPMSYIAARGLEIMRAQLAGRMPIDHDAVAARTLAHLRRAAHPGFTDEEWVEGASELAPWLDGADDEWRGYNLPHEQIWKVRYTDAKLRGEYRAAWEAAPIAERYRDMLAFNVENFKLTQVEASRSDAFVRMWTWRMMNSSHPFGRARRNDGADNLLPQHVSTGGILITNDLRLLGAIEACGTAQGPWVRHFDEAISQPLPPCFPWDAGAPAFRASFRRTSVPETKITEARWPTE